MANSIDALTSPTLKYLRERWWNDDFTDFLAETLRPRPGNRILDVGCGEGTAEVRIGRLHVSQIRMVGVDLIIERVMIAKYQTAGHNLRVAYATADAGHLPFLDGVFDSTFCVAVLQHIGDVEAAVGELARVTRSGGRVLAVEPDNSARYWYSATPAGVKAFETSMRFFSALTAARGEKSEAAVGPRLPGLFARRGIEPLNVTPVPRVTVAPWPAAAGCLDTPPRGRRGGNPAGAGRSHPGPRPRVSRRARHICHRSRRGRPRLR